MNDDCYYNIISFLDIKDIINISLVNKQFYKISKNELIWNSFYNNKFNNIKCTIMFCDNYKKCYMLNKFLISFFSKQKFGRLASLLARKKKHSASDISEIKSQISNMNPIHMSQIDSLDRPQITLTLVA